MMSHEHRIPVLMEFHHVGIPNGSVVKNPPAMQEMQVWSLDGEDSLKEEMATHSSIPYPELKRLNIFLYVPN